MSARNRVADFWDDVLKEWTDGRDHLVPPLADWRGSYAGTGKGAVDLNCYPDPYVGDLRGDDHDVRLVVLGLNPGRGYPKLQGQHGIWTQRIRDQQYSRTFQRSPAEDPETWISLHGKASPYWRNLVAFGQRWLNDETFDVHGILNFELYPWHSDAVTAPMTPPPQIVEDFVWAPCQEVATPTIFAFGAPWFDLCEALDLPEAAAWGHDGTPFPMDDDKGWRLRAYRLPSGQFAVVSAQPGYAGPPGPKRLPILRQVLDELFAEWDLPLIGASESQSSSTSSDSLEVRSTTPSATREEDVTSAARRRMTLVLEMVAVLHRRGHQRLRIVPGINGSGLYWRCSVTPASNTGPDPTMQNIDRVIDHDLTARWTNANETDIFGATAGERMTADELADAFTKRYPEIVRAGLGRDWCYAGWYVEMLGLVQQDYFPVFYADYLTITDRLTPLVTAGQFRESPQLLLPPPT